MNNILTVISDTVIAGDYTDMAELTQQALAAGIAPQTVLDDGLIAGMDYVGVEFKAGRMFVPEVLRSARSMQASMDMLEPLLADGGSAHQSRVLIGTVKGDLHDIGKNLVGMMCAGAGFEVRDLGKDVDPEVFVEAIQDFQPHVVGLSALLTTTMMTMERTIKTIDAAGLRNQVKILIGGAPVTQAFADHVGADGYASNAVTAAELARELAQTAN